MPLPPPDSIALLSALASLAEFACRDAPPIVSDGETAIARFTLTEDSAIALAEALVDVRVACCQHSKLWTRGGRSSPVAPRRAGGG